MPEAGSDSPNRLLAAELGTMITKSPPKTNEWVLAYLSSKDGDWDQDKMAKDGREVAEVLNQQRLQEVMRKAHDLEPESRAQIANEIAGVVDSIREAKQQEQNETAARTDFEKQRAEYERKLEKLQKTVNYWREQATRNR